MALQAAGSALRLTVPAAPHTLSTMNSADIDLEKAARVFKALSNPHRLAIFIKLAGVLRRKGSIETTSEGFSQCQLLQAQELGIAPSTISHHYKELRDSGLIRMVRQGKSLICHIAPETIETVRAVLGAEAPGCPSPDVTKE